MGGDSREARGIPPEQFPPGLPDDLQYVTTLFNAILGPNVLGDPEKQFRDFVPTLTEPEIRDALLAGKDDGLSVPCLGNWQDDPFSLKVEDMQDYNNVFGGTWCQEGWEIAVGLSTSAWPHQDWRSFMVYCRPRQGGGDWAWRYGWDNPKMSNSELYDTVEEYLVEWQAHCGEEREEDVKLQPLHLGLPRMVGRGGRG